MPRDPLLKFILDIESIIKEIEAVTERYNNNFEEFDADFLARRALERHFEIIGEAVNQMR